MADNSKVLYDMIGTPVVMVYTDKGEPLRYYDGGLLVKYLTNFEYTFDEENDDKCTIDFYFETVKGFELPYIKQDVVMLVRWGYILEADKTVMSPMRKIAVRDIKHTYSPGGGIKVTLTCTDLVSYHRSLQVKVTKKWSNPAAPYQAAAANKIRQNMINYIHELSNVDGIKTSIYNEKNIMQVSDNLGNILKAKYNDKSKRWEKQDPKDVLTPNMHSSEARALSYFTQPEQEENEFITSQLIDIEVNLSKNHRALIQSILDYKDVSANGGIGRGMVDSTDNVFKITHRHFKQAIYREYTFMGGTGELIEFETSTAANRIQVDNAKSSTINPLDKTLETSEISILDGTEDGEGKEEEADQKTPMQHYILDQLKTRLTKENRLMDAINIPGEADEVNLKAKGMYVPGLSTDYKKTPSPIVEYRNQETNETYNPFEWQRENKVLANDEHRHWGQEVWLSVIVHNIKHPENPITKAEVLANETGRMNEIYKEHGVPNQMVNGVLRYMNSTHKYNHFGGENVVGLGAKNRIHLEFDERVGTILNSNKLLAVITEKMVRKYNGRAKVVGDPSLIKGKVYNFNNLGKGNSGRWYGVRVSHKINVGTGYITELSLMRVPTDVTYGNIKYSANPVYDEGTNELTMETIESLTIGQYQDGDEEKRKGEDITGTSEDIATRIDELKQLDYLIQEGLT